MSRKAEFRQKIDQGPLPVQFPRNLRPKPKWHPRRLMRANPPHPVEVVGAASMGALLLLAGQKGRRYALPHSRIMIHQPLGGAQGQATDIDIQAREILRVREELNNIIMRHTGQQLKKIEKDTDRDMFLTPELAVEYGLIDEVIVSRRSSK